MYTLDIKYTRPAKAYLIASAVIAIASAVYGMFSHGVHSPFMTFAFAIPLLLGALPWLAAIWRSKADTGESSGMLKVLTESGAADIQLALITTLTAGSLLKGALDIYGTSNRLLIAYPVIAVMILFAAAAATIKNKVHKKTE